MYLGSFQCCIFYTSHKIYSVQSISYHFQFPFLKSQNFQDMMFKCGKLMLSVSCRDQSNQFQPSQSRRNRGGKGAFATHPRFCKINPITIREQIMPTILLLDPLDFQTFSRICGPPQTGKSFRSLAHNTFDFFFEKLSDGKFFQYTLVIHLQTDGIKKYYCILLPRFCDFQKNLMQS